MSPASDASTPEEQEAAKATQPEASQAEPAETAPAEPEPAEAAEATKAAAAKAEKAAAAEKAKADKAETAKAETAKTAAAKTSTAKTTAAKAPAAKAAGARAAASKKTPAKAPARKPRPVPTHGVVEADLPAEIFDAKVNVPLIHQVVVAQQAAARQGTHSTKTRGDVRGGGRKPYRQKGTGRARQGSTRAPQFAGGGVVHGPVPRSYDQKTPKKMKAAALRGALSDRARHGLVQVVDGFVDGGVPKTQDALAVLGVVTGAAAGSTSVLVVAESSDQVTWKSLRNAPGVHLIDPGQLNTYDVLVSDRVVFTTTAFDSFVARAGAAGKQEVQER
jgi:large subunit ribosomal protein L4